MRVSVRKTATQAKSSGLVHPESNADDRLLFGSAAVQSSPEMRDAMIRSAAYSFYERRGMADGHELEDWLQAETEIDRTLSTADITQPSS